MTSLRVLRTFLAATLVALPAIAVAAPVPAARPDCQGLWLDHATVRIRIDVQAGLFAHLDETVRTTLPDKERAALGEAPPRAVVLQCHPGGDGAEPWLEPVLSVASEAPTFGTQIAWKVSGTMPALSLRRYHVYLAPGNGPSLGRDEARTGPPATFIGENLIPNPSFEILDMGDQTNPAGWYLTGEVGQGKTRIRGVRSDAAARTGAMGFRSYADGPGKGAGEFGGRAVLAEPVPVVPGVRYHLLVHARILTATGRGLSAVAPFLDIDGRELRASIKLESEPGQTTNGFEAFRTWAVAPPEARFARLSIGTVRNEGATDVDDVALFPDPAGVPPSLTTQSLGVERAARYRTELPRNSGGAALLFDLGPQGSLLAGGFTAVAPDQAFTEGARVGFRNGAVTARSALRPDPLARDFIELGGQGTFSVALPNGDYLVWMLFADFRDAPPSELGLYRDMAVVKAEGESKGVLDRRMDFLDREPSLDDDAIALRKIGGDAVYERYVAPRLGELLFPVNVTDGVLDLSCAPAGACPVAAIGVFATSDKEAVERALQSHAELRRRSFALAWAIPTTPPTHDAVFLPTPEERTRGFVAFEVDPDTDVYPHTTPTRAAVDAARAGLRVRVARGETGAVAIGLWAAAFRNDATIRVEQPATPIGDVIGGTPLDARVARYQALRNHRSPTDPTYAVRPTALEAVETLDLHPAVTRLVWVNVRVPKDAKPGEYDGAFFVSAGRGRDAMVPITVEVMPFELPPSPVRQAVLGATDGGQRRMQATFLDLADHGMDVLAFEEPPAVTLDGARGAVLVDPRNLDEQMAAAKSAGMTIRGTIARGMTRPASQLLGEAAGAPGKRSAAYLRLVQEIFGQLQLHGDEAGWPNLVQLVDEPDLLAPCQDAKASCAAPTPADAPQPSGASVVVVAASQAGEAPLTRVVQSSRKSDRRDLWLWDLGRGRLGRGLLPWVAGAAAASSTGYDPRAGDPANDWDDEDQVVSYVLPERGGAAPTVLWERARLGVNDARYVALLEELRARAEKAKGARDNAKAAAQTLATIRSGIPLDVTAAARTWDGRIALPSASPTLHATRAKIVNQIKELRAALGE